MIKDKPPTGQPAELMVCHVKYIPIAGHKPKDFEKSWVDYDAMEIALRPVPSGPHLRALSRRIPTTMGSAVMSRESINITAANKTQIALDAMTSATGRRSVLTPAGVAE